jgi:hypothetical protein
MMSRRAQEYLVAAIIFFLFVSVLYMSLGYGPRARLVPVPIAVLGIILIAGQVIWQSLRSGDDLQIDTLDLFTGGKRSRAPDGDGKAPVAAEPADDQSADREDGWRRWLSSEIAPFALVGLVLLLFFVLGPLLAVLVFTAGYFILSGQCTLPQGLIYAAVCSAVFYLLFGVVLEIDLNRGLIMPFINQFVRF